tara:strand:+ start:688 stop:3891 length:3204 start_codon:yes stop_codon:yes gene_type:complete
MAYTRKHIKNLTGGVSEQPDSERNDTQCSLQENFISDPVKGLVKREGTNYMQIINPDSDEVGYSPKNVFTHIINRNDDEQLMLTIGHGGASSNAKIDLYKLNTTVDSAERVEIKDKDGVALTGDTIGYLTVAGGTAPDTHRFSAVTISDTTFIANADITPAFKSTTSGGTGMYERETHKRGLLFIKEGVYNGKYIVKATDSEGTTRIIRIRTTNSASGDGSGGAKEGYRDNRTDMIAGAIHAALEDTEATRSERTFDTSHYGSYTNTNTNIRINYSDDGTNLLFNGGGGTTDLRGSNYSRGYINFSANPSVNDTVQIDGGAPSSEFGGGTPMYRFEFHAAGDTSTVDGAYTAVEIGTTILETIDNLAAAINAAANNGKYQWGASTSQIADANPALVIYSRQSGDISGGGGGGITLLDADGAGAWGTKGDITGGDATLTDATSGVRNPITFERLEAKSGGDSIGSVISWFSAYPSKTDADASPIKIEITDTFGNTLASSFTDETESYEGLPLTAPNNYNLKVIGTPETQIDDYYIKFVCDLDTAHSNQISRGKWIEDMKIGIQYQLDPSTMPHKLVKHSTTEYRLQEATWDDMLVGDTTITPNPSFIGDSIKDVFFYKRRLGLLTSESVVLSKLDDPYNFFRKTATQVLATDRIDIASSVNEIVSFNYAVPFASQLLVFSDRHQFMIFYGDEGLTPNNSSLALISSYEASPNCRPVSLNNSIIFAQNKSDSVAVYELMPSGGRNLTFDGRNITSHVPSYIKGKAISLAGSSLSNAVILQTDDTDGELYLYNFFDQEGKRVRSSWSKIKLAADYVHPPHFINDRLYMIELYHIASGSAPANTYKILSYMKLDNTNAAAYSVDLAYNPPTSSIEDNDPSSGKSKITMEWRIADNTDREADIIVFDKSTGTEYEVDTTNSTNEYVVVTGAIGSNPNIIVGLKFTANYEFSKQYLKRQAADGVMAPIIDGRTVVKWAEVYFTNTQYLKAEVKFDTSLKRTNHEKVFTNTFASGAVTTNYGDLNSETERMRIMVASRNTAVDSITLTTDTYQIATITGATFELLHTSRLTRLS